MSAAGRALAAGCRVGSRAGLHAAPSSPPSWPSRGLSDGSHRLPPLAPSRPVSSRGWGLCLDDPPAKDIIDVPSVPPGVLYDVSHQCRLQYGAYSAFCDDMDNVCHTLWCSVGTTCHSKLDAAVDGTRCGENKWCLNGECVPVGFRPEAVDGGWSSWSAWSICSRSCGVGIQSAERQCTQPAPRYKGKYYVGEQKRFRLCNLQVCPAGRPSFCQVQCSRFDVMLYKGQLHTWVPVVNNVNPCELHCRPSNEYFAKKLRDAVVDGTPCYQGRVSHDLCIDGIWKNVGCDFEIDSGAVEDRCGVCHGNGSTCHTMSGTFEKAEGLGYVDVGLILAGTCEIRIQEVAEAANFLALRSEDPKKYFLSAGWTIQWDGDYQVAGTTFTYARRGNWENLTSPGPTNEPVWIQVPAPRGPGPPAAASASVSPLLKWPHNVAAVERRLGSAPSGLGGRRGRLRLTEPPACPPSCCSRRATPGCGMSTPSTGRQMATAGPRCLSSPGTTGPGPRAQSPAAEVRRVRHSPASRASSLTGTLASASAGPPRVWRFASLSLRSS
ncbi:A disintegrin and metalloproteinase with thrombospondin motifs 7 [Plecturocebus cupreus]